MIEANNPEINVDELMDKIRQEVAMRQGSLPVDEREWAMTPTRVANINQIEALLNNAEFKAQVRTDLPKKLDKFPFNISKPLQKFALKLYGFLFKEQRAVNFSLIEAVRESLALNKQLIEQIKALQVQVNGMSDRITATDERVNGVSDRITATDAGVNNLSDRIMATDVRLAATNERVNGIGDRISATEERHLRNDTYLKNDLAQQKRLITLFLEEARQRLPEPFSQEQLQTLVNEDQHLLDAFYAAFEDQFRGSREDIFKKLKVYIPLIEEAKVGTTDFPILDVGCGRGEWLELLSESGFIARGLDINRALLDECKNRGFDVIESDVIAYLQSLPDGSLGAVTGFHIIEHLPFTALIKLLNETARVLKPGGLAIFETPNPKNLVVGACNFYSDPTHRNPLFPETVQFMVNSQGLSKVKLLYLNPVENSPFNQEDANTQILDNWFFGPRDYAVVGYKG